MSILLFVFSIVHLDLQNNFLTGTLPFELEQKGISWSSKLEVLRLDNNELSGTINSSIGKFQSLFKSNFVIVDNSDYLDEEEAKKKFVPLMKRNINVFVKKPIRNPIAKMWIKKQQILKKKGK